MSEFLLWGVTASPYQLKMQALLDGSGRSWQRWPEQGDTLSVIALLLRLQRAKRRGEVRRYPGLDAGLDEYPAVPFYTRDRRQFYYDSSSLGWYLHEQRGAGQPPLAPEDPALAFLCHLIDEAFDEFGLYMVHHMRWVGSARSTLMGERTAAEMGPLGRSPLGRYLAQNLYRRQVRRCPYLFSVAPVGFDAGVEPERTPPRRDGFPPTHALLEGAWRDCLAALEQALAQRPYLFGEHFTLADASVYGQLGMNLVDPEAADLMKSLAPGLYRWLCAIHDGRHRAGAGTLSADASLRPLLEWIAATFLPLMQQNEAAYEREVSGGATLFNEAAFEAGRALYDGELMGHPFRAVVKTFQVQVWRRLKERWRQLPTDARKALLAEWLPDLAALD